jgi:hypothetical protein
MASEMKLSQRSVPQGRIVTTLNIAPQSLKRSFDSGLTDD